MKLLIVIDCQHDFIDGVLGTPEARAIVPAVAAKVRHYVKNGDKVIYTRDTRFDNYLDTAEGQKLPVPHCIKFSEGWQIVPEVYEFGSPVVDKITFGYTGWSVYPMGGIDKYESIELVGVCTGICVINNALILKALAPETPIIVDSSCCACVTPESHENALTAMQLCQIDVI